MLQTSSRNNSIQARCHNITLNRTLRLRAPRSASVHSPFPSLAPPGISAAVARMQMRRFGNPDSAGSQFIICMGDMREELDGHFAAFGKVLGCRYSGVGFRVLGFRT